MVAEGYSASVIAKKISTEFSTSITRNAVIGRSNRLKVSKSHIFGKDRAKKRFTPLELKKVRKARKAKLREKTKPIDLRSLEDIKAAFDAQLEDDIYASHAILTIVQLGKGMCRFPTGMHDDVHTFCGKPAKEGSSYCEHHHKICMTPLVYKRRNTRQKPEPLLLKST
jgi:hypothetical protein